MTSLPDKRVKLTGFQFRWLLVISAAVVLALGLVLLFLLRASRHEKRRRQQELDDYFHVRLFVMKNMSLSYAEMRLGVFLGLILHPV